MNCQSMLSEIRIRGDIKFYTFVYFSLFCIITFICSYNLEKKQNEILKLLKEKQVEGIKMYQSLIPRVSTFNGISSSNIIIVAPHKEDIETNTIAEEIINELNCYGVINNSWSRKTHDCNNVNLKGAAKREFLDPIIDFTNAILIKGLIARIFIIHGVSDDIRLQAPGLDFIIGNGNGNPPKLTCNNVYKNGFMVSLQSKGYSPFNGKAGGNYSGWHQDNLNQLFVNNNSVRSLQVETVHSLRKNVSSAKFTGIRLAECIKYCQGNNSNTFPEI